MGQGRVDTEHGTLKTCSGCGQRKHARHFAKNTRDASGLQPWCKSCHRRYNRHKPKVMTPTVLEKRCSTCRQLKATHEFNKDVSKPTGLRSQCNACRSYRRHIRRHVAQTSTPSRPSPDRLLAALLTVADYERAAFTLTEHFSHSSKSQQLHMDRDSNLEMGNSC